MRSRSSNAAKPTTIDEYLLGVDVHKRVALERLRRTIRAAAPDSEECISYQMPAFRIGGKVLLWFGAASNHCSFFPGTVVGDFKDDLQDFETSKGTIRFQPDHPLPAPLVRKIVKARIAANARPTAGRRSGRHR